MGESYLHPCPCCHAVGLVVNPKIERVHRGVQIEGENGKTRGNMSIERKKWSAMARERSTREVEETAQCTSIDDEDIPPEPLDKHVQ